MVQLVDLKHLNALSEQLDALTVRCQQWDQKITLTENKSFRFEVHLFTTSSLTLSGYCQQIHHTFAHLKHVTSKNMDNVIVQYECERFINQFSALLNIVNQLDAGKAEGLYKRYSTQQEKVYQQLQRQYQYEQRLLTMISEENILYQNATTMNKSTHKARISALKKRYQKCNEFTQSLEFKMEALDND
ncbi:primosomal protein [Psychromonas sp. RZ22]|uniref:primosomal replication protein PriC n=1 Tax=Psychromonas algarum TaxID=2555643 RepID=UPI0010682C73|nr:primosomal replication protein PriC [Psychromonas sp. RZ22]TEW56081.1 primosomal protein [Psychromonas sp. RZ22]